MGIDVDNGFKPLYVVPPDKRKQIRKLKDLLGKAEVLYLATDEDREGEAIAWHLYQELKPPKGMDVKRMVFHEITRPAIEAAIAEPRDIDRRLVDAQEARRILDRLYGYEVSPVLWKKVQPRLSAGRVQSVATRIAVERERERMAFVVARYWSLTATFGVTDPVAADAPRDFSAGLATLDGKPVATGSSFTQAGELKRPDTVHLDESAARTLAEGLREAEFRVRSVERKPYRRRPAAPFMTSTFQQEAGRKLRMSATAAMRVAQSLYEKGYITYMRTDSTTLSQAALNAARDAIAQRFGAEYLPDSPRRYAKKVKNAQEAHEAIRPAGDRFRSPEEVRGSLSRDEARAYELVWKRTVASQMTDAVGSTVQLRVGGEATDGRDAEFTAAGTTISHYGFRRVYSEGTDADGGVAARASGDTERPLPAVAKGDRLGVEGIEPAGHETSPPARYTEASLVKRLEELGVGRPSTYASIMNTIQDRGYVWKRGTALVPTFTAFSVVRLLEQHFSDLVDYTFTARMEDELDNIATGDEDVQPWLRRFYFGAEAPAPADEGASHGGDSNGEAAAPDAPGLKAMVSDRLGLIDAREVNSVAIGADGSGADIVARVGRFGPYVGARPAARDHPGGDPARRADRGGGPGADRETRRRPRARQGSGHRPAGDRPDRPLRTLCPGRHGRGQRQEEAEDRVAAAVDDARRHRTGRCPEAAFTAPDGRDGPRRRHADHRPERTLRAVHPEGVRQPHTGVRGADVHHHRGRVPGDPGAAEGTPPPGRRPAAAARARRRPGDRPADGAQGWPLGPVRH